MDGSVGVRVVADANVWIQPDAASAGLGVVGVDEAAFGGFEVVLGEGVGDAAEVEGGGRVVEGGGVEGNLRESQGELEWGDGLFWDVVYGWLRCW